MDDRVLLVRFEVLAANRRHFDALFFAVVAFSATYALAAGIALRLAAADCVIVPALAAGSIFVGGGFVAHRLLKRERSSFAAMCGCWAAISGKPLTVPDTKVKAGAMTWVVTGLYVSGVVLLAWAGAQALYP